MMSRVRVVLVEPKEVELEAKEVLGEAKDVSVEAKELSVHVSKKVVWAINAEFGREYSLSNSYRPRPTWLLTSKSGYEYLD